MEARLDRQVARVRGPRHELGGLLALILLSLTIQLAAPDTDLSRLLIVVLQGVTLLVALWVSEAHRRLFEIAAVAVAISVVLSIVSVLIDKDSGEASAHIVTLLLVALAPLAIAAGLRRDIAAEGQVTLRTMFGVLCIYLLLGMFFAIGFTVVQQLTGDPFFSGGIEGDVADFLYYSFSTMTTTGFGDLTAAYSLGRSLTILEALIGQIYLVTVVAMIVANIRPRGRTA